MHSNNVGRTITQHTQYLPLLLDDEKVPWVGSARRAHERRQQRVCGKDLRCALLRQRPV